MRPHGLLQQRLDHTMIRATASAVCVCDQLLPDHSGCLRADKAVNGQGRKAQVHCESLPSQAADASACNCICMLPVDKEQATGWAGQGRAGCAKRMHLRLLLLLHTQEQALAALRPCHRMINAFAHHTPGMHARGAQDCACFAAGHLKLDVMLLLLSCYQYQ